uniref:MOR2-PAG1_mid domain-containing protein n=1 Tax=Macrostomum lignano TaxID=282301 RepID=A0A1I8F8S1_9PLAT
MVEVFPSWRDSGPLAYHLWELITSFCLPPYPHTQPKDMLENYLTAVIDWGKNRLTDPDQLPGLRVANLLQSALASFHETLSAYV